MNYEHSNIEAKWQKYWAENETFKTDVWDFSKPKYYVLDMFPYPSGVGLHAGHPEGYTATDIVSRMKRMQGYNVLHPMGYDSFGLPAEQYAVTTGNHPNGFTQENIKTFSKQLTELGFAVDDLVVREHGSELLAPVNGHIDVLRVTVKVELLEYPLCPLVEGGIAGCDHLRPVVVKAKLTELL